MSLGFCRRLMLVISLVSLPSLLWAAGPERVSLPPTISDRVALTVTRADQSKRDFTVAQIESLGVYRLTTKTFWPKDDGTYEGVLLADFLKEAGLEKLPKIQVTALDGYSVSIPREDWTRWPVLLATRRDGAPLSVRNKGPLRLIFPMALDRELSVRSMGTHWAWMIRSISPAAK